MERAAAAVMKIIFSPLAEANGNPETCGYSNSRSMACVFTGHCSGL